MSCKSLLPTNLDPAVNALDIAGCERLKQIEEALKAIEDFHDAMKINERFLDLLADSYEANRFKEFEPRARELILYAQRHYPKLGTVAAVKEVMHAFGLEAEVKEWFETGKEPYLFDLDLSISDRPITKELVEQIFRLVEFTKNIRSKLGELLLAYKVAYDQSVASGGVGESRGESSMKEGYGENAKAIVAAFVGGVGESFAYAKSVGLESKNVVGLYSYAGMVGEATATTICKEFV
ncbi:MAG: phage tail protein I [Epsilonproteobacteria bacterium]|nr:phage tail protein I [Campylobacterota bacterium]